MRVGIVGDLHAPFVHPMYLRFCLEKFAEEKVDKVVLIGDVVDQHALSFHEHDPNGMSAEDEALCATPIVEQWYQTFPKALVCIGNHDSRHYRMARKSGLPDRYLRTYADVWNTPKWKWAFTHTIEGVLYIHGTGTSGKNAHINAAIEDRCSRVQGHVHSWGGFQYHTNEDSRIFGMNCGNGIDIPAYAFAYAKEFRTRPTLGCGVVIDGEEAKFLAMPCGDGERFHRKRAGTRQRKLTLTWQ
jgi:predicted phosphodiesterase